MVTNGYTTVAVVKGELGITDSTDDTRIDRIVTAVSRQIDDYLGHHAYPVTETRYYRAQYPSFVVTDPFTGDATVSWDFSGNWTQYVSMTNVLAWPDNASNHSRPYTGLQVRPFYTVGFPLHERGVQVTASFGHGESTPPVIAEATIMQCAYLLRAQNSGGSPISGGSEFGQTLVAVGLHPFVKRALDPLRAGIGGMA